MIDALLLAFLGAVDLIVLLWVHEKRIRRSQKERVNRALRVVVERHVVAPGTAPAEVKRPEPLLRAS